jgi:hypothetical protein
MHQPEGLPRGVQIAECWDGYFLPHTPEAKANARLIAAAPELLNALQNLEAQGWFSRIVRECEQASSDSSLYSAVTEARAAVAKATGSTP